MGKYTPGEWKIRGKSFSGRFVVARIWTSGLYQRLGFFDTEELAQEAINNANGGKQ